MSWPQPVDLQSHSKDFKVALWRSGAICLAAIQIAPRKYSPEGYSSPYRPRHSKPLADNRCALEQSTIPIQIVGVH